LAGRPVRQPRPAGSLPRVRRQPDDSQLKKALESFRRSAARTLHWKKYMVFSRAVIDQIDLIRPDSVWALGQVRGFGASRIARFGEDILRIVAAHTP
jgi:superfamily II DNA helicase RecQ